MCQNIFYKGWKDGRTDGIRDRYCSLQYRLFCIPGYYQYIWQKTYAFDKAVERNKKRKEADDASNNSNARKSPRLSKN